MVCNKCHRGCVGSSAETSRRSINNHEWLMESLQVCLLPSLGSTWVPPKGRTHLRKIISHRGDEVPDAFLRFSFWFLTNVGFRGN